MAIALKYQWGLLGGLMVGMGILLCLTQFSAGESASAEAVWLPIPLTQEQAQPLQSIALLPDSVLWRPLGSSQLVYQRLDGSVTLRYDWLRGIPLQWQLLPTGTQSYFLWRTLEGDLWVALLSPAGAQLTAPIEVAKGEVKQFGAVLTTEDEVTVAWIQGDALQARHINAQARPLTAVTLANEVQQLAITIESNRQVVLAWQSEGRLWLGQLDPTQLPYQPTTPLPISELTLGVDDWVSRLLVGQVESALTLVWGVTSAAQPQQEHYQGLVLPQDDLTSPIAFDISIPAASGTRWATLNGQQLTLAANLSQGWQPVVIGLGATGPQGYQVIAGPPVDASPVANTGQTLVWVTLDEAQNPQLVAQTLNTSWGEVSASSQPSTQAIIEEGLSTIPMALFWLIAPCLVAVFTRQRPYQLAAMLGAYWIGKALLPIGFWEAYPAILSSWGGESRLWVGGILIGISLLAGGMGMLGWGKSPQPMRHAAYFLTDLLLTCAILGGHIQ